MKAEIVKVWVDREYVHVLTAEGEERKEAVSGYERLQLATPEQLQNYEVDNIGIHWPDLDEDLCFDGFFNAETTDNKGELYALFKSFPQINVAALARSLGIKQSLMAAYVCGSKKPSAER